MKQVNYVVGGVVAALVASASSASAQQVMWKDNPITGKVVGLTYGTSGWNAAEAQAVAYGGHLAAIRSQAEQDWLVQQFSSAWSVNFNGTLHGPWFGLNDALQHTNWVYPSGDPVSYTFWASGQGPAQPAGWNENYGFLAFGNQNWSWHDGAEPYPFRSLIEAAQRPPRSWSWPSFIASSPAGYSCVLDVDGDGADEIIVPSTSDGRLIIYRQSAPGNYSVHAMVNCGGYPNMVVPGDVNGDGLNDLLVADLGGEYGASVNGRLLVVHGAVGGQFLEPISVGPCPAAHGLDTGDLNADGRLDVVVASGYYDDCVRVYLGGVGGLSLSQTICPGDGDQYGIEIGDINRDGRDDVAVAGSNRIRLYVSDTAGALIGSGQLPGSGVSVAIRFADTDGDGDLDAVSHSIASSLFKVWINLNGQYVAHQSLAAPANPYWVDCDDIDGDGDIDAVVAGNLGGITAVYYNNGSGSFAAGELLRTSDSSIVSLLSNVNGDAKPDIVTVGQNGGIQGVAVVLNQSIFDCNGNSIDDALDIASGFSTDCNSNGRPDSCDAVTPANDCNGDSILDVCQLTTLTDCNSNARLDTCDLAAGAPDCNGNQILDVCEQLTAANDCNANGLLDYCELVAGTVPDCDLNGRPDSCDLAAGLPDCNLNQVPDACDLGAGTSNDGDLNNIPDECSLDCNANGLLDTAECAQGLVADCNGNLVPDSCDLVAGVPDCNTNGVPDSCDVAGGQDCNANGQPDACDLAAGGSDCNGNQQLDSCELAAGGGDCNGNQQFDACELLAGAPDCNGNGAIDACDIAAGAADCDGNQVPDACQALDAASDCNANLILDVCDILGGAPDCNGNGRPDSCDVDTNGDQIPDECQDGGTLYCFGDGAANSTPCPCGGVGAPRSGCPNSVNPAGGYLVATGLPSRIADTLVLRASQMPPVATVLYFQGTSQASTASGTIGTVFGDGLRCAAGAVVRVGFRTNSAGASEIPSGGSPALHIAGQIPATGAVTRYYQGWYRDVNPSFCTANRYNLTNGVAVVWVP